MRIEKIGNYTINSSCYFLDLRNSTSIIRNISDPGLFKSVQGLKYHSKMLIKIYEELNRILKELKIEESYINDTGDGHLCLIRGKNHAVLILIIVCHIAMFTNLLLIEYNSEIEKFINQSEIEFKMDFGIGIHSGSSIFTRSLALRKNFAFGNVINSASRVESFTKKFPYIKILFTGGLLSVLDKQSENLKSNSLNFFELIEQVTKYPADVNDGKKEGHKLYTVLETHWPKIAALISNM